MASTTAKMTTFAPMQSASVRTAVSVKPGLLASWRRVCLKSESIYGRDLRLRLRMFICHPALSLGVETWVQAVLEKAVFHMRFVTGSMAHALFAYAVPRFGS